MIGRITKICHSFKRSRTIFDHLIQTGNNEGSVRMRFSLDV